MDPKDGIDRNGMVVGAITLLLSFILFFSESSMVIGSLFAAVMAGGLAWLTYVVIRMLVLTFTR